MWVRTYPVTFLHDVAEPRAAHLWHQLVFAVRGHLEVATDDARRVVPADRAVWIPAGIAHSIAISGWVSMRTLYIIPKLARTLPQRCFVVAVSPSGVSSLLNEYVVTPLAS